MSLLFIYILCGFFKWKLRNTSTSNFKQKQQLYLFIFLRLSLCLFSFSRYDKFPWPRSKPTKKKEMTQNHAPVFLFLLFKGIFPVITHLVITNMFYKMYNFNDKMQNSWYFRIGLDLAPLLRYIHRAEGITIDPKQCVKFYVSKTRIKARN